MKKIRNMANQPIRPALLFGLFVLSQALLLDLYIDNKELIANTSFSTVRHSIIPSLRYGLFDKAESSGVNVNEYTRSIPVLNYHGVVERRDGSNIYVADFKSHMFKLKKAGYDTVTYEEYRDFMYGKKELPKKSFLLTFDDGRKDSYYPVDPILRALDYEATMFVIGEHSLSTKDSSYYLDKEELKKISKNKRWSLQAHTDSGHGFIDIDKDGRKGHFYTNYQWLKHKDRLESKTEYEKRVRDDLISAKAKLEDEMGVAVSAFAFPFGDYGQEHINNPDAESFLSSAAKEIYNIVFVQSKRGYVPYQHNERGGQLIHQRFDVSSNWTADNLVKLMTVGADKELPYKDNFSDFNGWTGTYGDIDIDPKKGLLVAAASGSSTSSVLMGSSHWKNYIYSLSMDWKNGSNVMLVAGYRDDKNYIICNFGKSSTHIEQVKDGVVRRIAAIETEAVALEPVNLTLRMDDGSISCSKDGRRLVEGELEGGSNKGSIGLKTWDAVKGKGRVLLTGIDVVSIDNK